MFLESVRRVATNTFQLASRWWASLGEPARLLLNQRLYVCRNQWREPTDLAEFRVCCARCVTWINLPELSRSAGAAKIRVHAIWRQRLNAWLRADPSIDCPA